MVAVLTLIMLFEASKAKLSGAVIVPPLVVHVEVSSSAMKASLKRLPTHSGYSSVRKRKSKDRQLASGGTSRSILRIDTSQLLGPRTLPPPSSAPLSPAEFGWSASEASPFVRIANVAPS